MLITCNGFKYFYNKYVHGVPFDEAAECIFSTQATAIEDLKHSTPAEKRYNLITISPKERVLCVGFCKRQNGYETRIISARPASRKERKAYEAVWGNNLSFKSINKSKPKLLIKFLW